MANKLDFGQVVSWGFKGVTSRNFLIRLILWTAALILFLYSVFGPGIIKSYGVFFQANYEMMQNPEDMSGVKDMFSNMGKMYGGLFLMSLVLWAIIASAETAYHKNVFFKEDKGFFPLRFGRTELKVMVAQLFVYLSFIGVYLASILALVILIMLVAVIGSLIGEVVGAALAAILGIIGFVAVIVAIFYTLARLSPAAALTVRDDKIRTVEGWRMTKGNAAPIAFAFLLIGFIGYVVMMIIQFGTLAAAFGDSGMTSVMMGSASQNPAEVFAVMAEHMTKFSTKLTLMIGLTSLALFMPIWYLGFWGVGNRAVIDLGSPESL